jgi:hypothetical protein
VITLSDGAGVPAGAALLPAAAPEDAAEVGAIAVAVCWAADALLLFPQAVATSPTISTTNTVVAPRSKFLLCGILASLILCPSVLDMRAGVRTRS